MNKLGILILSFFVFGCMHHTQVDLIIHNASILHFEEGRLPSEAMAIADGRIVELGPERQILNKYRTHQKVDMRKRVIMPGFVDGQNYLLAVSKKEVKKLPSNIEQDEAEEFILKNSDSMDNYFLGWKSDWTAPDIEFENINVLIRSEDGSGAWEFSKSEWKYVSGKTLDLAVSRIESKYRGEYSGRLSKELNKLAKIGYSGCVLFLGNESDIEALKTLERNNLLPLYCAVILEGNNKTWNWLTKTGGHESQMVRAKSIAYQIDGGFSGRGALLKKAYSDSLGHFGLLYSHPDSISKKAKLCKELGFQLVLQTVGDSATALALDMYDRVLETVNDHRWRLENVQLVEMDDLDLFRKLSIIPSVIPQDYMRDEFTMERIGERIEQAYPWRQLRDQNRILSVGSAYPLNVVQPWSTVSSLEGIDQSPRNLERKQALFATSYGSAMGGFLDAHVGTLDTGKSASFIVLNANPLTINKGDLGKIEVLETWLNGTKLDQVGARDD